jgi:hypothetical protein
LVDGINGENAIRAEAAASAYAWLQAVAQARALGMLDSQCRFLLDRRSSAPDTHADLKTKRTPAQPNSPLEM